ncbi:MAG: endonuclease/exonuclease/phosphatase family protein [Balneolaceae bacterium]
MTFIALAVLTLLLAILTFLPVLRYEVWWIRILDFPRLQLASAALLLLIFQFIFFNLSLFKSWAVIFFNILVLFYQASWILPFSAYYPVEVNSSSAGAKTSSIRIITANVLETNKKYKAFLKLIQDYQPDIFVALETNVQWQEQFDTLGNDYPFAVKCPKNNLYGMHVYSRLPLENACIKYLVEPDVPSIHATALLPSGRQIQLYFLHPKPPFYTENEHSTERDAELLLIGEISAEIDKPVVVTGDLNDVAWSDTTRLFRKISRLLDPRIGRGMFNTFHTDYWFIRWPLDYFFHSSHFTLKTLERLPPFGSDHFAILIELNLEPDQETIQHTIPADSDDKKRADEKIQSVET